MLCTYNKVSRNIKKKCRRAYRVLDQYSGEIKIMLSDFVYRKGEEVVGFTILKDISSLLVIKN